MDKVELNKIRKKILLKKLKQDGYLKKDHLVDNNGNFSFISKQQLQQLSLNFETLGKSNILTCKFTFNNDIDLYRLEKSFYFLINRHPILSTIYQIENNKINLIETKKLDWKILLSLDPVIDDNLDPKFNTPIRIRVKKNNYDIDLFIILHHIAFDEISWQILLSEISYYYSTQKPLDDKLVFSNVQPNFIVESKAVSSKEHWQKYLSDFVKNNIPDSFSIYRSNSNNIKDEYKSKVIEKKLNHQFIVDFQNFAKSISVSPISLLIASVALILERNFCQDNIVIGTAIDQRETDENFKTIGNFVSIIPIIVDINSNLAKIAQKVHQDIILGFKNRFISLEDIISNLQIKGYGSRHPLIDFIVLYRKSSRSLILDDKEYSGENIYSSSTLFDLIISIDEHDLSLTCQYKDNLIPNKLSLQILNDLFNFLNNIQFKQFYDDPFNDVQKLKLSNKLSSSDIVNIFIELTIKQPDFIAVEYMSQQFTRIEILQAVFKLVSLIKDKGVILFDNVIIATSKSIATPICYLSSLYCGITFIPFDINSSRYRLLNFINSSNPRLIITSDEDLFKIKDILEDSNIEILNLNISDLLIPVENFDIYKVKKFESLNINQPAYIIFTSGTTGYPKGVLISRNSLNFVLQDMADIFANDSKSYLSISSLSFDISIFEILAPLYYGVKLIIGEYDWSKNPKKLADKIKELNPSIIELTPSLCNEILYYDAKCMQRIHVCCGGEKLSTKTLDLLLSNYSYVSNLYGPTEITIISTKNNCNLSHNSSIGKALNNTVAIVLDHKLRPVPNGILGELYLFGSQIAQYYINNPSLTANKFVANPFYKGQRMYRTGDLVYKNIDTLDIYFCGRSDEQLSIHGVRVEPEEIEFEISKIKGVDQCAIKVVQVGDNSVIHGYFVGNISPLKLELKLKQVLPNYLRPVSLNKIDKIPKSISDKIDRKSLPEPKFIIDTNTLPTSELEILVANCFEQILDIKNVKNKDNFFFLGGYSLQIASLINLIESKTSIRLAVKDIFDHPTVEEIVLILSNKKYSLPKNYVKNNNYNSNFKLSDAQKRILAAYQLYDQKNLYNMPLVLKISGQLNVELFKQSLILVLQKHKILNTIYDDNSLNYGKILSWDEVVNNIDTIFRSFILDDDKIIYEKINNYIYSEFKLNTQIPIKVFYFQGLKNNYLLFLLHHIVADEFSLRIIFDDIKNFYNNLKTNKNNFNIQSKQYFDVIEELGRYSHHALQFWEESFKNIDLLLDPPFSNKKLVNDNTTYHQQIILSDKQINLLNALKNEFKSSTYHVFISIVITLLSRLSQKDVIVGIPVLGRDNVDYEQIVGYFSNTLPIRVLSDYSMSCKDIILKTRNVVLEALDNSQVPLEKIYSNGVPFSVFIDYRSYKLPNFKTDDFIANSLNWDIRLAKFPVIILYNGLDNKIDLLFSSQYYQENSSLLFKRALYKTIDFFCNHSNNNISNINYYDISNNLYNFNYNQYFYKQSDKFNYIFEKMEQVAFKNSDNYAISGGGYNLKYSQLFLLISKISSIINESNIYFDEIVAIYSSKRTEQLILMLAVLHSGHAYVVLDANYPQSRINFLLKQINTKLLLNAQDKAINLLNNKEILIDIHDLVENLHNKECYIKCNTPISPNELAYLCFTSGTTANPKGVLITHSGLSDFVNQVSHLYKNLYKVDSIRMLSLAPMTFDVGLAEALFVLSNAGHLKVVDDYQRVGNALLDQLKEHNVTHLSLTPSVLETLGNPDNVSKDIIISVGAEKVSAKLFSKWSKNHIMVNLYGPTEDTINSLSFVYNKNFNAQIVPVGLPDIGVSAVILDDSLNPVPIGFKGELYLGGTGLARGYINNVKETALRFIPSLFTKMGNRIYRTGDLASISEDGNIILHGRMDDQFKIRGLRIDPLEIENAFLSLENILMSWVGVIYDNDRPVLLAFIVNSLNKSLADVSLEYRKKLKSLLPQYLIPQVIVSIEKLPLTNNGKIDKKEINNFYNLVKNNKKILESKSLNESKKSSLKIILDEISNLLSIPTANINVNNSFLEIGGDSIIALQLMSKLKQNDYDLSAQDLLENHSIKELSLLLDDSKLHSNKSFGQVVYDDKFIDNEIVAEGDFSPLPIVKEYLSTSSPFSLFAYSLLINSPSDIFFKISDILKKIISLHTALRTRYINKDKLQTLDVNDPNLIPQIINFDENINIEFAKQTLGKLLNPYYARNIVVGILHYNEEKLLLVMVHHLASDIVSLQIILNDLKKYYDDDNLAVISNNSLKKCSFILNSKLNTKNTYDLSVINKASIISKAFNSKLDTAKKAKKRTISLSDKTTKNLFSYMDVLRKKISFKINLDVIFIFIISKVIGDIDHLGLRITTIDLERNGRDDAVSSGIVGWFTKIQKIYCLLSGTLEEKLESILDQIYNTTSSINSSDNISEVLINYIGLLDKKLDNKRDLFTINNYYDDLSVVYDDNLSLRNPILLTILEKENQNNNKNILLDFIFSERLISSSKINNFINLILKEIDTISNNNEIFNKYLPLTYTQEGLIQIENENIKGKKAYVINMKLFFKGNLDVNKLYTSWVKLLSRHPILNSSFHQDERGFYAKISYNKPDWDYVKLPANFKEFDIILKDIESDIKNHSFVINKAPLYKVKALSRGDYEHILIFCLHHILADGWSAPIIMRDLFSIYNGEKLTDIPNISNSIKMIKANVKENTKIKWRRYLRGANSTYITKDNANDDGKRVENSWYFDDKDLFFIQNFCKKNQITLASLIHALWAKTLKQIVGSNTVSFGSVTSGRPSYVTGIDKLVGLFSNSIPILVNFDRLDIVEIAKQIGSMLVLASDDPVSFSQLLQLSGFKDLFDNLLVLENYPFNSNKLFNPVDGVALEKYEYEDGSHYPLTFIININSGINFRLSYNANAKFIVGIDDIKKLFIENFNNLKQKIVSIKNDNLEKDIFNQLNATSVYGVSLSGLEYYLNINQCEYYLSQLTRKLISLGCHIQKNIVLSLPRSLESVLLMVSILRTGACFVPVDYEMEDSRYLKIINKVKPHLIINSDSIYELGLNINFDVNIPVNFNKFTINERTFILSDLNYAYIIHTSGTTGEPKGINMPWRMLNYLCKYHYNSLKLDKSLTIAHFAPNYFDVCIQEILTSFIFRHHLVIVPEDKRKNIDDLALFFEQQRVDVLFATNLIINQLAKVYVNKKIPNLSYLIQSGEKLEISDSLVKWCSFEQSPKLFNEYGPSETHVICVNHNNVNLNEKDNISVGKQILGTNIFVLDDSLSLLGVNQVGELYIIGEALSYGYIDDCRQTSTRYVATPDYLGKDLVGKRMYRTGDIAYKDSKDQIYCIGRIDEQVKIKGVRIEIEEIVKAFMSIDGIYKAFVVPNLIVNATSLLSAVILDKQYFYGNKLTISSIKQKLKDLLPKSLIPDVIKIVEDVPVNKNNKLDKQELRKILLQKDNIIINKEYFFENHDLSIDIIKSIIKFVLDTNVDISNDDDFFALGGHSLLATKLANQINNAFNSNIQIKDIFELRTPINIFKFINRKSSLKTKNYTYKRPNRVVPGPAQMRFWALSELGLSGKTYHIPMTLRLTSVSNNWNFNKLFNHFKTVILNLIFKHESLRTIINSDDKGVFQVVLNNEEVLKRFIPVKKTINKQDTNTQIDSFHSQEFNLSDDLMLRFGLFNLNKTKEYVFLITLHHICCDAWSISIILNDIKNIFDFLLNNPQSTYTSDVTSYIDEIGLRDEKWQDTDVYNKDLDYWRKQLFDLTCPLNLPLDYKRTNNPQFKGDLAYFNFGKIMGEQIKSLSQQKSVTYFMLIQACIAILLNKIGCGDDIVIGVPDSGREDIKSKEVVGCFINLLVLRFNLSGNPSFSDILNNIRKVSLDAYSHVSVSFDILVRVLGFSNVKSHHPLFTVGVGLQDASNYQFNLEGFNIDVIDYHPKVSRYDINFDVILDNDNLDLKFVIEYDTNLFKKKTIHDLMDRLRAIIETVLLNSNQRLSDFNVLLKEERLKFYNSNNNYINRPRLNLNKKVLDIVNGEISNDFNLNILINDYKFSYSYKDLQEKSNKLAKFLVQNKVNFADNICIICSRNFSFYVGILAVLRVGATYVPLLPDIPQDRLVDILKQTEAKILITDQNNKFLDFNVKIIDINPNGSIDYELNNNIKLPLLKNLSLNLGAYIIFTSGTTGSPKGILINRYSLACMLDYIRFAIPMPNQTIYLSLSPFCFDLAVYDVLGALSCGFEILILDELQRKDPSFIKKYIKNSIHSTSLTTPSLLSTLLSSDDDLDGFKNFTIFSAGEALPQNLANKMLKLGAQVFPMYGPAETVIVSNGSKYKKGEPSLGDDFRDVKTYVLDEYLNPVPQGVIGQIYLAGEQIANGYISNRLLTSSRFVANKFFKGRMYCSGDLGFIKNNKLYFAGRIDNQVSIRGHRVEITEILNSLNLISYIKSSVVKVIKKGVSTIVVAYVVFDKQKNIPDDINDIKNYLSNILPDYMIPSIIIPLDYFPLTVNGKINLQMLPEPTIKEGQKAQSTTQKEISNILSDLIFVNNPNIDDNFVELGMDSISVIILANKLNSLGYNCTPKVIFDNQTINLLAKYLDKVKLTNKNDINNSEKIIDNKNLVSLNDDKLNSVLTNWSKKRSLVGDKDE